MDQQKVDQDSVCPLVDKDHVPLIYDIIKYKRSLMMSELLSHNVNNLLHSTHILMYDVRAESQSAAVLVSCDDLTRKI